MPGLWKSTSNRRPKPGSEPTSSIRGRISGPIPIPDDEFPIRTPGSGIAIPASPANHDDDTDEFPPEFPIRKPGTGSAAFPLEEKSSPADSIGDHQGRQLEEQVGTSSSVAGSQGDAVVGNAARSNSNPDVQIQVVQAPPPAHPPPEPPCPESRSSSGHRAAAAATATPATAARISPPRRTSPPIRTSPPRRTSPPIRRTATATATNTNPPPPALRYSTLSETTSTVADPPKRKKSTLRTALGRLFGRGRKKNGNGNGGSERGSQVLGSSQQHRSDPSALTRSRDTTTTAAANLEQKRSASLPITEYDRALRSHSIGPQDVMAIESARNSLQATVSGGDAGAGGRKRAATTGGRLYPPLGRGGDIEGPGWGGVGGGLSPRPASTHGRGSRVSPDGAGEDPSEIGRAITSDSGGGGGGGRRRSRSLSGLKDVGGVVGASRGIESAGTSARRRSDEIRYWRESYDPGFLSPLSSGHEEGDAEGDDADDANTGVGVSASPVVDRQQQPPKTPPQPFDFGSITRDMVGMKITQAASMDARMGGLETRMARLERTVEQLCHAVPGFRAPLVESRQAAPTSDPGGFSFAFASSTSSSAPPPQPPSVPAIYQDDAASSHMSFGEGQTYIGSLYPPSGSATGGTGGSLTATAPIGAHRPTSDSTVRVGATSLPTLGAREAEKGDESPSVLGRLEAERAARRALEAQVEKLSQRLNTLSATMYAMVRSEGGLAKARSQEQLLLQPLTPTTTQEVSSLPVPQQQVTSALSVFETEDEEFVTPGEERSTLGGGGGYGYGAFGEELRDPDEAEGGVGGVAGEGDDDPKRKKAARTLSLSQLTLGKKGAHGVGQQVQI